MWSQSLIRITGLLLILLLIPGTNSCEEQSAPTETGPFPEARKQNIDVAQLVIAFEMADQIDDLRGLAVARNGVIVAERYYCYYGPAPDPPLHVMSVTKSISATLVGICLDKGYIDNINQPVSDFLGADLDSINPQLAQVTIRQLLTMSAGQDWKEIGPVSEFMNWVTAPNQLHYIYEKPLINPPGTVFNYSDGSAHMISAVIQNATGMTASAFADSFLFKPLDLGSRIWNADKQGISFGGVGLCIGIYDMIAFGQLYLNEGSYNEHQIVSSGWIEESTGFAISTGSLIPILGDYGYFWWLGDAYGHHFFCANGYGGQFILVCRELNLVIAARTNWANISGTQADENWDRVLSLIVNEILPAVN